MKVFENGVMLFVDKEEARCSALDSILKKNRVYVFPVREENKTVWWVEIAGVRHICQCPREQDAINIAGFIVRTPIDQYDEDVASEAWRK
jgi:hypothetical protein